MSSLLFTISSIGSLGGLGAGMQINANANQICKVATFIGDIHNDMLLNFTWSSTSFFDYNFINDNAIIAQGFNFGMTITQSSYA